jgi:prevent-host-death family protein
MITVTSGELQRNLGRYQDEALTQPISVTRNGRERIVLLAAGEYRRLKRRDREVLLATELSEEDIEAIAKAEVDPKYNYLDDELK